MLKEALDNKKNNINNFVWKGKKVKVGDKFVQEQVKLVDSTEEELKQYYDYCNTMLDNDSKENPGRRLVLEIVKDQRLRCNVELFLRSLEATEDRVPRYMLNEQIQNILSQTDATADSLTLKNISSNCPNEFKDLPINLIIEGCIDRLGVFSRKHLTLAFILKQGVWLTEKEIADLTEKDEFGNIKNKLDVIRDRLNIDKNIKFRVNTKGLSYASLRAMLQLKNKKYSELTTDQLTILRNRILFNLENDVISHIKQWERRKTEIELVAKSRKITL